MKARYLLAASLMIGTCAPAALAGCGGALPDHATLTQYLKMVMAAPGGNGGLGFPMWATVVDETGIVCAVTNSLGAGADPGSQIWIGSRVISAQKANTATSFSNGSLSLSTANLYAPVQPGGSLFGLQESNPVDPSVAYKGPPSLWGAFNDPMVGSHVGGINVFGGGLTLYSGGRKVGAIGVSGDTSCTDHVVAWKVRKLLALDSIPGTGPFDKMIQDLGHATPSGFGHPLCLNNPTAANDGGSIVH